MSKNITTSLKPKDIISRSREGFTTIDCFSTDIEEVQCSKVALCRCQQSRAFPLCDGSHKTFNQEANSSISPLVVDFGDIKFTATITENRRSKASDLDMDSKKLSPIKCNKLREDQALDFSDKVSISTQREIRKVDKSKIDAIFTEEEVAKHCTKDDCWMIINGKVYDVTQYFPHHPGGERALLKFGGKDGSENVQFHSSKMLYLLDTYFYIGRLANYKSDSNCTIS